MLIELRGEATVVVKSMGRVARPRAKHRPGREATRRRAIRIPSVKTTPRADPLVQRNDEMTNRSHMARLLVADATLPPRRDGRTTPTKNAGPYYSERCFFVGGANSDSLMALTASP
jgi:hypothetical protein